jgi:hypothetical protein
MPLEILHGKAFPKLPEHRYLSRDEKRMRMKAALRKMLRGSVSFKWRLYYHSRNWIKGI